MHFSGTLPHFGVAIGLLPEHHFSPMKPALRTPAFRLMAALAAGLGFSNLSLAQSVTTPPVGAVSLTMPQGITALSLTLEDAPVYSGAVTALSSASITTSTATWTASAYSVVSSPFAVRFRSGALAGSYFKITANTGNVLTLDTKGLDLSTVVLVNDTYSILPVDTLGTLFGTSAVDFQTGSSAALADNIFIWSGSAFFSFFHNGTNWRRTGSLSNQNDTVIMPDDGFMVVRRSATPLNFTITGQVRDFNTRPKLNGSSFTLVANHYPVDRLLSSLPFRTSNNWTTGASALVSDNVFIWSGSAWLSFFHNGTSWRRTGSLSNQDSFLVTAGSPFFVRRISSPTTLNAYTSFTMPFTL